MSNNLKQASLFEAKQLSIFSEAELEKMDEEIKKQKMLDLMTEKELDPMEYYSKTLVKTNLHQPLK